MSFGIANPLFYIGVVENNVDPRKEGRVQVRAFGIHGLNDQVPTDELPWAIVVQGGYDPNAIPKINSWVFGVFLDGRDAQQPLVLGLIPTNNLDGIDPSTTGWGYIPERNGHLLAQGSEPESIGQPQISRKARGEYIQETNTMQTEAGRFENIRVAGEEGLTWSEPETAYGTEYPHNRVFETGCHTIELDDTPGSERIQITHKNGSYIQIDSTGAMTTKATGDSYDIMDRKQHVYVKGMSSITIDGNAYVYVKGNKVEEIEGDLTTLVHGNHMLSVGGQSNINASEQVQVRGADVKIQANVGTMAINAGKELQFSTKMGNYGTIAIKSEKIMVDATDKLHIRGNTQVNIQSIAELNMSAITFNQLTTDYNLQSLLSTKITSGLTTDIKGGISLAIEGGVTAHVKAPFVYMDEYISMANGGSRSATPAVVAPYFAVSPIGQKSFTPTSATPEIAWYAAEVAAPEPTTKSTSVVPAANPSSVNSSGYASQDETTDSSGNIGGTGGNTGGSDVGSTTAAIQSSVAPLLDFIGNKESRGYDDVWGPIRRSGRMPSKPLTEMTIQEVLNWQESIDRDFGSEAAGRYQFMEDTLRGYNNDRSSGPGNPLYTRAGLSASDMFSPINQDKLAIALMEEDGLTRYMNGEMSIERFANNLAGTWASLPLVTGSSAGYSRYEGDSAGNRATGGAGETEQEQARNRVNAFLTVLREIKSGYIASNDAIISGGAG